MDCSNAEELIERLAEAQGTFQHAGSSTRQDERVNDGANYVCKPKPPAPPAPAPATPTSAPPDTPPACRALQAGLMSSASYKEKRKEMTVKEDVQANRDAKIAAARAQITADRDAKDAAAQVGAYLSRTRASQSSLIAHYIIQRPCALALAQARSGPSVA